MKNKSIVIDLKNNCINVNKKKYLVSLSKNKAKTSNIYITKDKKYVFKYINFSRNELGKNVKKNPFEFNLFEREVFILNYLNKNECSWVPKIYCYDKKNKIIMMEYCGDIIKKENLPKDYELQIQNILDDMKKLKVKHNDIKINQEILVKKGKIFICDWGWASINNGYDCGINLWNGTKPHGVKDDSNELKKISKNLKN